uniref:Uncharacterized protein LOC105132137 isoform X2 n=1 Tax=Rhizophora mucronata TaxID=61149 RepID=A0A2P2LZ04_RHIMU
MAQSLEQDLKDKLTHLVESSENDDHEMILQVQDDQGARNDEFDLEGIQNEETEIQDDEVRNQELDDEATEDSGSGSPKLQSPQQISSFSSSQDLNPVDIDNVTAQSDDASPDVSSYSGDANIEDGSIQQEAPKSSSADVWSIVSIPNSHYNATASQEYTSNSELSFPHQLNGAQKSQLIDLESDVHDGDTKKDLLQRQPLDGSFNSYSNHDRSGLLQSLIKGQEMPSYHHEQKHTGLDFQSSNNMLMDVSHFNGQLHGPPQASLPPEHGQKRHGEDHMRQSISDNVYPEDVGYLISRQGHVESANMDSWAGNSVQMPTRLQCHMNDDGLFTQNWFSGEHQAHGDWAGPGGVNIPGQGIGSDADQSLFSVLSQGNQLSSISPFPSVGSTGQFVMLRNYGMVNGLLPATSNPLPQASLPLDYLSTCDASSSLMPDDLGWISLPQNPALRDEMGKPYLRSWNQ